MTWIYPFVRNWMGQLVVVTFLFFSGFGITEQLKAREKYAINIAENIFRVWIHYIMTLGLYFVMNYAVGYEYNLKSYVLSLFALERIGNSNWYIFAILSCYFFTFIVCMWGGQNKGIKASLILFVFLLICIYIGVMKCFRSSYWYNTILCYPLGMLVSKYIDGIEQFFSSAKNYYLVFIFNTFATCILGSYNLKNGDDSLVYMLFAIIFSIDVLLIIVKFDINNPILHFFGKYCFEIYLLQRIPVNTGQAEHSARSFRADLPLVQCTLSGKQSNPLICLIMKESYLKSCVNGAFMPPKAMPLIQILSI